MSQKKFIGYVRRKVMRGMLMGENGSARKRKA